MTALRETVTKLELRLSHLEEMVQGFIKQRESNKPATKPLHADTMTQAQLLVWLKAQGIVREPTAAETHLAAEWQALSESAKQKQVRTMH